MIEEISFNMKKEGNKGQQYTCKPFFYEDNYIGQQNRLIMIYFRTTV